MTCSSGQTIYNYDGHIDEEGTTISWLDFALGPSSQISPIHRKSKPHEKDESSFMKLSTRNCTNTNYTNSKPSSSTTTTTTIDPADKRTSRRCLFPRILQYATSKCDRKHNIHEQSICYQLCNIDKRCESYCDSVARGEPHVARVEPHDGQSKPHDARGEPHIARVEPHVAQSKPHVARSKLQHKSKFLLMIFFFIYFIETSHAGSFYGSSFVSLPLQDAKSNTDISFRFRTSRSESLLFLAAGKTDYCLIMLQQGILKVHINLGAGETEISSPLNIRLDDISWHEILLTRKNAEVELTIDSIHTSRAESPGRYYELNIHYGLFVGGMGDFNKVFLGNQKNFRGCLEDVMYNGVDVLMGAEDALSTNKDAKVHNLDWDCAEEFSAESTEPITFLNTDSYVAFPSWISRNGGELTFSVKTISSNSVLLYNNGHMSSKDFIALELYSGRLRFLLDQGNGVTEVSHDTLVADGKIHNISLAFSSQLINLEVDGEATVKKPLMGPQRYIDLTDRLYIGGISLKKKSRAIQDGVKSGSSGLQGCISDLYLDGRNIGFPEVLETFEVRSGCTWQFPCANKPCLAAGESCTQEGMQGYTCTCSHPPCTQQGPDTTGDLLSVSVVQVEEGRSIMITPQQLKLIHSPTKLGISEHEIFLHIVELPKYGSLKFVESDEGRTLSYQSLRDNGILYTHAAAENTEDSFIFETSIAGHTNEDINQNSALRRQRFIMKIRILPVNDRPLVTVERSVLKVVEGSTLPLHHDLIQVSDSDSQPDKLIIVVTYNESRDGYIESSTRLGERVTSFRLAELEAGLLQYVQKGGIDNSIAMQAWDGEHYSNMVHIRFEAIKIELELMNNTGISVSLGSNCIISSANLSFISPGLGPDSEIKVEVVSGPSYGRLQRQRGNGKWVTSRRFTQKQIDKGKVRYVHSRGNPRSDYFTFTAQLNGNPVDKTFTFTIKFININIQAVRNHGLRLENVGESVITENGLMYQTFPQSTPDSKIIYRILSLPREGNLLISKSGPAANNIFQTLNINSTFSQVEILSGRLKYKLAAKPFSLIQDQFTFQVSTPNQMSNVQIFSISYLPGDTSVDITLEGIEVEEGGRKVISNKYLEIRTLDYHGFGYNVTEPPRFGWLNVLAPNKVDTQRQHTLYFTSAELAEQRLVYHHDDSESRRDSFSFLASKQGGREFQYSGVFHIHVLLRNDQTPTRAVDNILQVVENGEKVLTPRDLLFTDMDIDTRPADIKFESRATPNGELVYSEDPSKRVSEFTQQDINDGKVMFRHRGSNFGRILIWVNDGQLWVSTELKVRASKPFVQITNNTGLIVQRGDSVMLTTGNLTIHTNLNTGGQDLIFTILEGPHAGTLLVQDNKQQFFTLKDLVENKIEYSNHENSSTSDFFLFKVNVGGTVYIEDTIHIQVFPESYWDGLKIGSNNSLFVEEGTSIRITESDLRVLHGDIAAEDIKYTITQGPTFGFLEVDPQTYLNQEHAPQQVLEHVTLFSQSVINQGRLHYIQSSSNQTRDSFTFDVSNGISSLQGLVFQFIIIPKEIYIETRPLVVSEGSSVFITEDNINVLTSYYEDKIVDYLVMQQPSHGYIMFQQKPNNNVTIFTSMHLAQNKLKYIHDGSDSLDDCIVLVARTGGVEWPDEDKTSVPAILKINILAHNDAMPRVVNNTGLVLWAGSTVNISTSNLSAEDPDTNAGNITYSMSSPHCGMVSLRDRPVYPISQFTEQQLRDGLVIFTHSGCYEGGFYFTLFDGQNRGQRTEFRVEVQQLNLIEKRNKQMDVFPGTETIISNKNLFVQTSNLNQGDNKVLFLVTDRPSKGMLMYRTKSGRALETFNFTQADINEKRIVYRHTAKFMQYKEYDFFKFEAVADYAPYRLKSVFNIVISLTSSQPGGIDKYVKISNILSREGSNTTLSSRNINISGIIDFLTYGPASGLINDLPILRIKLVSVPDHGTITLRRKMLNKGDSFTQNDVEAGVVVYSHDHSDSAEDKIGLAVFLLPDMTGLRDLQVFKTTMNISVTPVNDKKPFLVTKTPSMVVVRGQSKIVTKDMLEVQDPDTPANDIRFTMLDSGLQGSLVYASSPSLPISTFSQKDINEGRVMYVHDGATSQTQFYFSVTDGRFQPRETGLSRHFRIHVIPLSLELKNQSLICLEQGTTTAIITSLNMGVHSNGDRERILYTVKEKPGAGQLLVQDNPADSFYQVNIDRGEVIYMQTDMTHANDSFLTDVSSLDYRLNNVKFHVAVTPLVIMKEKLTAAVDSSTAINSKHLDATKLGGLTSSNPVFHILDKPMHGRIKRIIRTSRTRTSRSLRDREIQHFTQEDLSNGVIYFVGSNTGLTSNTTDQLIYKLEAPGVQPAKGIFRFTVISSGITSWAPLPNVTPTGHAPVPVATRKDIVVASCVVASLLLVIVTAIIIVRCRKEKYNNQGRHSNGHICQISGDKSRRRQQNHFDDVYTDARSGIMSLSKDQPGMCTPHLASDRFVRKTISQSKHNMSDPHTSHTSGHHPSDSDSWLESSRSRDTSPSSSIPPSLPAFRVIPLCENELAASHLLDPPPFVPPPFSNRNSNDMPPPVSEAGSNPSDTTFLGERSSLNGGQPLLRRNQYWV